MVGKKKHRVDISNGHNSLHSKKLQILTLFVEGIKTTKIISWTKKDRNWSESPLTEILKKCFRSNGR